MEIPHLKDTYDQIPTYFLLKEQRLGDPCPIWFPQEGVGVAIGPQLSEEGGFISGSRLKI